MPDDKRSTMTVISVINENFYVTPHVTKDFTVMEQFKKSTDRPSDSGKDNDKGNQCPWRFFSINFPNISVTPEGALETLSGNKQGKELWICDQPAKPQRMPEY